MKAISVRTAILSAMLGLAACATTDDYPTQITRFHSSQPISRGQISIQPFADTDGQQGPTGPEFDLYAGAVARELGQLGWTIVPGGQAEQVALIGVDRQQFTANRPGPVSLGVGGGTGGWHSGAGAGLGFNLGGGRRDFETTTLVVRLKRSADQAVVWEGRAIATERTDRQESSPDLLAPKLATGLFQGFPGESGRTIRLP